MNNLYSLNSIALCNEGHLQRTAKIVSRFALVLTTLLGIAFTAQSQTTTTYDDSHSSITYGPLSSTWVPKTGSGWEGNVNGTIHETNASGASAQYTGTFTGVEVIGCNHVNGGIVEVVIDGAVVTELNTYNTSTQRQAVWYTTSSLSNSSHTVIVRKKNISNDWKYVRFDALRITTGTTSNTLNVSPTSLSFGAGAASSNVSVTANVSWTVSDNQTWITVTPSAGTVGVSVTANSGTASRSGTVTVTGGGITRTVSVTQAGSTTTPTLTVTPASLSFDSGGGTNSVTVNANVSWSATDNQTWISISPSSAAVGVTVTANSGTTSRSGTVTITGGGITRTVSVSQSGVTTPPSRVYNSTLR